MEALKRKYRDAQRLEDGRIVVLDRDNMWRTFSDPSDPTIIPQPKSYAEKALSGEAPDMEIELRQAGIALILGMAGVTPDEDYNQKGIPPIAEDLYEACEVLRNNLSAEGKMMLGILVEQLTGLPKWQFMFLVVHCPVVYKILEEEWSLDAIEAKSHQVELAEHFINSLYSDMLTKYVTAMNAIVNSPSGVVNHFKMDLKALTDPFIQALNSMDIIRNLSIISGWKDQQEQIRKGKANPSDYPPNFAMMNLAQMVQTMMNSSKHDVLILHGKSGFQAAGAINLQIEKCLMSLSDIPNTAIKTKAFLLLRDFQARLETAMAGPFDDDKKPNMFAQARMTYGPSRESLYNFVQIPKTLWAQTLMDGVSQDEDPEQTIGKFQGATKVLAEAMISTEIAYNLRPWIDTNYLQKINAGIQFTDFGASPPHSGFLSKHSPRVARSISQMIDGIATHLAGLGDDARKLMLRDPSYLNNIVSAMTQGVKMQEKLVQQARGSLGIDHIPDMEAAPDTDRLFEDPEIVKSDIAQQQQEAQQQQMAQAQQAQAQAEQQQAQQQQVQQQPQPKGRAKGKSQPQPPPQGPGQANGQAPAPTPTG
ncbi:MAG: hypothetical protein NVS9B9_08690 [Ktedonobacteraceae bacterium]